MNIVDALKQNKTCKVKRGERIAQVHYKEDILRWLDTGNVVQAEDLLKEDWEPYMEKKEVLIKYFIAGGFDKKEDYNSLDFEVSEKLLKNKCKRLNDLHYDKFGVKNYYNIYRITFTDYHIEEIKQNDNQ